MKETVPACVERVATAHMEEMGTRYELMKALHESKAPAAQKFLNLLADPVKKDDSISVLAKRAGLDPMDLALIYRNRYANLAMMNYFKGLPQMATDIVTDAFSIKGQCPECGGMGRFRPVSIPETESDEEVIGEIRSCPRCEGTGEIRKPGDADARRIVAEATGQIKSKSGVNVNIQQNFGMESVIDDLEAIEAEWT
jgi:hypothetical protein